MRHDDDECERKPQEAKIVTVRRRAFSHLTSYIQQRGHSVAAQSYQAVRTQEHQLSNRIGLEHPPNHISKRPAVVVNDSQLTRTPLSPINELFVLDRKFWPVQEEKI